MENYNEIKQKAEDARKNKKWDEALDFYQKIIDGGNPNKWDSYFYAFVLMKKGKIDDSMAFCRAIYLKDKKFNPNNSLYARNIYKKTFIKPDYADLPKILKGLDALKMLIPKDDEFISFEMFFHNIMKTFETDKQFDFILKILSEFYPKENDYKKLEDKDYLQKLKYPTFVESYFVAKIKANYMLANYEATIEHVDKALNEIKRFNYGNHVWIRRLKALSLNKTKKTHEALKEYFYIIRNKKDWFILFELAQILDDQNYNEAAEYYCLKALKDKQDAAYKVNLFKYCFQKENWQMPTKNLKNIVELLNEFKNRSKNSAEAKDLQNKILAEEIEVQKAAEKYFSSKTGKGKVIKMFGSRNGLIQNDKENLFFVIGKKGLEAEIDSFYEYEENWNYDNKKNKVRKSCILIKKI